MGIFKTSADIAGLRYSLNTISAAGRGYMSMSRIGGWRSVGNKFVSTPGFFQPDSNLVQFLEVQNTLPSILVFPLVVFPDRTRMWKDKCFEQWI